VSLVAEVVRGQTGQDDQWTGSSCSASKPASKPA